MKLNKIFIFFLIFQKNLFFVIPLQSKSLNPGTILEISLGSTLLFCGCAMYCIACKKNRLLASHAGGGENYFIRQNIHVDWYVIGTASSLTLIGLMLILVGTLTSTNL